MQMIIFIYVYVGSWLAERMSQQAKILIDFSELWIEDNLAHILHDLLSLSSPLAELWGATQEPFTLTFGI